MIDIEPGLVKCLAGIILNNELFSNGFINKLLMHMNESDYEQYNEFIIKHQPRTKHIKIEL